MDMKHTKFLTFLFFQNGMRKGFFLLNFPFFFGVYVCLNIVFIRCYLIVSSFFPNLPSTIFIVSPAVSTTQDNE